MSQIPDKQAYAAESDEMDLSILYSEFMINKYLILFVTLFVFAIGAFYASRQVQQYQSDVLLQIESNQSSMGQGSSVAQQFMFHSPTGDTTATQIALIQSRFILEPVIQSLGLDITAKPTRGSAWAWLTSHPLSKKTAKIKLFDVPRNEINQSFDLVFDKPNHISVYNSVGDTIVQGAIGSLLTNADKTVRLQIEAIKAPIGTRFALIKHSDEVMVKSLSGKLKIDENGAKGVQNTGIMTISLSGSDADQVVRTLNSIAKITQVKDSQTKSQEAAQTLTFLYHQLPVTKGQLEKAERALNQYRATSGKIDIKLQTQFFLKQLSELDKQLGAIRINKIEMQQRYMASHPILVALDTQIKALEAQRKQLRKNFKTLPSSDQVAVNLMREVGVKKALYLILLRKIQELEVVKAGTVSSVHILSFAKIPDAALPGKRVLIYMGSILLGLMLSILIIAGRKLISPRVEDPHWGEKHFNLANLAIVPYCEQQAASMAEFKERKLKGLPLLAHDHPRNLSVESLRSLRTSIQITLACASNNIVSILGVSPGVGKSFVSVNLAYLLAAGGKRVLLIDGDLRRGTLHKYLSVPASPGLTEVINKTTSVDGALTKTMHDNLTFLSRGAYPKDPSELLMSDYFKELMSTFAQQYDVVVIDTAPVLLVTDAVIIGSIAANNYLVMGAGAHQPQQVEIVLKRLAGAGVKVQGSVFNFYRSESITQSYGQYGKYGKYSYYNYNSYYYDESIKS